MAVFKKQMNERKKNALSLICTKTNVHGVYTFIIFKTCVELNLAWLFSKFLGTLSVLSSDELIRYNFDLSEKQRKGKHRNDYSILMIDDDCYILIAEWPWTMANAYQLVGNSYCGYVYITFWYQTHPSLMLRTFLYSMKN